MILLDTSALLWVLEDSARLGLRSRRLLLNSTGNYVSAISMVEIVIKQMAGKLDLDGNLVDAVEAAGLTELPYRYPDSVHIRNFPQLVGHDPFDRMLVAQAEANGLDFLTSDRRLLTLDRPGIVDATA